MRAVLNNKKLESIRKDLGYNKTEMGKRLKVSTIQYSRLERGLTGAGLQLIYRMSKVLNVSMDQLVMETSDMDSKAI